jgi:transcription elongation factor Elf1
MNKVKLDNMFRCPRCGGGNVAPFVAFWDAQSKEDPGNRIEIVEHQCRDCEGESFWV